jgi:hypothetical protein
MLLDDATLESAVGDDVIEVVHQLCLRHHRQPGQVVEFERVRIDIS